MIDTKSVISDLFPEGPDIYEGMYQETKELEYAIRQELYNLVTEVKYEEFVEKIVEEFFSDDVQSLLQERLDVTFRWLRGATVCEFF